MPTQKYKFAGLLNDLKLNLGRKAFNIGQTAADLQNIRENPGSDFTGIGSLLAKGTRGVSDFVLNHTDPLETKSFVNTVPYMLRNLARGIDSNPNLSAGIGVGIPAAAITTYLLNRSNKKLTEKQAFINGFVKRAAQYEITPNEAIELLKKASVPPEVLARLAPYGSLALGLTLSGIAMHGMKTDNSEERINAKETADWAKKYLNSKHVDVKAVENLQNAYYTTTGEGENKKHIIRYDPRFRKSVAAHEIGHGMGGIPRVPGANFIGPLLTSFGAFRAGYSGGQEGMLPLLAGVGVQLPTVADEWLASHNAKKILKDHNVPSTGLTRAWLTYTAPLLAAGLTAGAGYLSRKELI